MKIFSFRKPVLFKGDEIKINDLSRNHNYRKEGERLVVEGVEGLRTYKAFYNLNGKFLFIKIYSHEKLKALLPWKLEYDIEKVEKIDSFGNRVLVVRKYVSTSSITHKLCEISFSSDLYADSFNRKFVLENGKWSSKGEFPKSHLYYWMTRR